MNQKAFTFFSESTLEMQAEQEARLNEPEKEQRKEKLIAKKEGPNNGFFDQVNQNYAKRSDELEHFSKHLFNLCADLNSECIHSYLNTIQHFVEMQNKHSDRMPMWYPTDQILNWMEQNNKSWVQALENTDSIYTNVLNNCKNFIRVCSDTCQSSMQFFERNYEFALKNLPKSEN